MPSIKNHVKEGPQTPSGSLINRLPFMQILIVPAASSRTCNDTLLGALLASASDSEGVPQPVHARARPPSAPCGTQEPPLEAQVMQNGWASNHKCDKKRKKRGPSK